MKRRDFLGALALLPFVKKLPDTGNKIRGMRANSCIVDDYQEISPELFGEITTGFAMLDNRKVLLAKF